MPENKSNNSEINIVTLNGYFSGPEEMLETVRKELQNFPGKRVILVFRELPLGYCSIYRKSGRELAQKISALLDKHGSAFVAYSILERSERNRKPGLSPVYTNSGYLVSSRKNHPRGYQVYPKITTFHGGTRLTASDELGIGSSGIFSEITAGRIFRMAKKVKAFPRIKIGKTSVELRVCSDATVQQHMDKHPAKTKKQKTHIVLIPSNGAAKNDAVYDSIAKQLALNGIGVIADIEKTEIITRQLQKTGRKRISSAVPEKIGRFRIKTRL